MSTANEQIQRVQNLFGGNWGSFAERWTPSRRESLCSLVNSNCGLQARMFIDHSKGDHFGRKQNRPGHLCAIHPFR